MDEKLLQEFIKNIGITVKATNKTDAQKVSLITSMAKLYIALSSMTKGGE